SLYSTHFPYTTLFRSSITLDSLATIYFFADDVVFVWLYPQSDVFAHVLCHKYFLCFLMFVDGRHPCRSEDEEYFPLDLSMYLIEFVAVPSTFQIKLTRQVKKTLGLQ